MKPITEHRFIESSMRQWRLVITITGALFLFGLVSFATMPRQEFPEFTVRQGLVIGVMPGATPLEVEERLARPLESFVFSFNEVNKVKTYTVSKAGQLFMFVELADAVKGGQAPAFWAKLRHGLNELKPQLPSTVVALVGNNDFGDTSALLFTVEATGRSPREMQRYLEVLESHLRRLPATAKLRRVGLRQEVVRVSISRERLARYGVRPALVLASLQGLGSTPLTDRLDTDDLELPVHVTQSLSSEKDLGDTILLSEPTGAHVRLADVAKLTREYGHDDAYVRYNGRPAVVLSVEMRGGNDITAYGRQVDEAIAAAQRELPQGVVISRVADQPKVVGASVGHFLQDFGLAVIAVIAVTMLLLPVRVALVAAISIPVCIAVTIGILNALGVQLQTVSLAALVVVLGMVVDNAIVVIDDYVEKLDQGLDRWTAAWKSAQDLYRPVFVATVAIILAYVPMAYFLTGISGDFIGSLPLTVSVALVTSFVVACLLVPVMNYAVIRHGVRHGGGKAGMLDWLQRRYDRALEGAFRHRWVTLGLGLGSIVVAVAIISAIPQQPFPKVERDQFAIEVYLRGGSSLGQTDAVIARLEKDLLADRRVRSVTSFVGSSSPRFHTLYAPHMPARSYGQLIVNTATEGDVPALIRENETRWRERYPEAWLRWKQLDFQGAPPIQIRLSGGDLGELRAAAGRVVQATRTIPGAARVASDFEEPVPAIEVAVNTDAAARVGVSPALLQTSLAFGLQGFPVATLWEGDYPVAVVLEDESSQTRTIEGLRQQYVTSPLAAATVPLEQVARVKPAWQEGAIVRRNGVRTLTVTIDVLDSVLAAPVQREVEKRVAALGLAPSVRVDWGGEPEIAAEVYAPLSRAMLVSIALIYLVLLWEFERHRTAMLVMLSMPLVLFGAAFGLIASDYPFGMTAFMGVIGLLGVAVRNGIILVGYAEELRETQGLDPRAAALAAGKRRMRPVYLTSMAAAVGVIPMILSRSTLWGPLGAVTGFGLLFGMVLTLFVLPVAYALVAPRATTAPQPHGAVPVTTAAVALLLALMPATARAEAPTGLLTLERSRALTLENNAEVKEAALEVEAAEQTKAAAFTKYFPQVSASAAVMAARSPLMKIDTQGGNLPVYDGNPASLATPTQFAYLPGGSIEAMDRATVFNLSATQTLFAGGRIVNGNRLADLGVEVAKDKVALAQRDALAATLEKYWRLVTLGEKLQTVGSAQALLSSLEQEVGDAARSGLITDNDRLKVDLQRRQLEADRKRLADGITLATRDLRHHVGLPDDGTVLALEPLAEPQDPAPLAARVDGAVERRAETRLLHKALRAEELQTDIAIGEMLPTLALGGMLMRYDIHGLGAPTNNALVYGVATVPLTALWEGAHAKASHERRERVARARLDDTTEKLALQVTKSWTDLQAAWRDVQVADIGVEQATVNLRESEDRHRSGLSTSSDLLDAQVELRRALDRRTEARAEYWIARSGYLRACGEPRS